MSLRNPVCLSLLLPLLCLAVGERPSAQGVVSSSLKYSQDELLAFDSFGNSVAGLGDVDGDGIGDVAVGSIGDEEGISDNGSVWILFLRRDGTVRAHEKISVRSGWFDAQRGFDLFGSGVAGLGDFDGDGVPDLAVAAPLTQDPDRANGVVYILLLKRDGSVKSWTKVAPLSSVDGSQLAHSVACIGDVDGNGVVDLAVGQPSYLRGFVWILFLKSDGTLLREQRIGAGSGGFGGTLHPDDFFGMSLASPGDLDGDGVPELAVGASDDDGGVDAGALWMLFLRPDGTVKKYRKISARTTTRGSVRIAAGDRFGSAVCAAGDLDGDGVGDVAVGANQDDDGGLDKGAVWLLTLRPDGSVKSYLKISAKEGGFAGELEDDPFYTPDQLGTAVALLGDIDGNGFADFAVGIPGHGALFSTESNDSGAAWILRMKAGSVVSEQQYLGETPGWGSGLPVSGRFGSSIAVLEDIDGNGVRDLAVGAPEALLIWILFLNADGTVKSAQPVGRREGGFGGGVGAGDAFGASVASLGDLDGDGIGDFAAGVEGEDDGARDRGAAWIVFLNRDGTVKRRQGISSTLGGFEGGLDTGDAFGCSAAAIGDLDGDGIGELVLGAEGDDDGGLDRGAAWVVFLNHDGTVKQWQKISSTAGGFGGTLHTGDLFGCSAASIGDLDGDGLGELVLGAEGDDDRGTNQGAAWILFLAADGTVRSQVKISELSGLGNVLDPEDRFGGSVAGPGDVDGDGIPDLAVGAMNDDQGGIDQGAVWVLLLRADGGVRSTLKIGEGSAGFGGQLNLRDRFGGGLAAGELIGDGVVGLFVGAPDDLDMGRPLDHLAGAAWALFLDGQALFDAATWSGRPELEGPSSASATPP